eukprot:tig00001428_g8733.t1
MEPHGTIAEPPLDSNGARRDGRSWDDARPIFLKTGVVSQASGSAYVEMNKTKVICAVYGPRQSDKMQYSDTGKLNCDFKFAAFATPVRKRGLQTQEEKEASSVIQQALGAAVQVAKFPKSVLDVFLFVVESDGGALAAGVTAAALAVADAGVEMYDLVAGASAAAVGGKLLLDPTAAEERAQSGSVLLATMPSLRQVTHVLQLGQLSQRAAVEAMELCEDACGKLHAAMRECLVASVGAKGRS